MDAHKLAAGRHVLYDREAAKRPAELQVNSDLLEKARELGVDLSATLEDALALELQRRERETWLEENREAIEAYNEYVAQHGILHGEVLDTRDVITFQGKSVDEFQAAFRESIDDYLEFCAQRGEEPDKPFSGRLMARLSPHLHRKLYAQAKREGKSLNQLVSERLERAL